MSTMYRYQLPVEQTQWTLQGETQTSFTWEYEDERAALLALYDKGKKQQWDAAERIDWSVDLDPEKSSKWGAFEQFAHGAGTSPPGASLRNAKLP